MHETNRQNSAFGLSFFFLQTAKLLFRLLTPLSLQIDRRSHAKTIINFRYSGKSVDNDL